MDSDGPAPAAASAASVVFGCDDLLGEILLRLGFPHFLIRAALVSKRWLLYASDNPAFLRRFRDRHPPRLLGFCVDYPLGANSFVPLPQPPELAAVTRRVASSCNEVFAARPRFLWVNQCRNGRLVINSAHCATSELFLLTPLLAECSKLVLPPILPNPRIFLPEDGSRDGIALVHILDVGRQARAIVCMLGSDGWGVPTTAVTEIELTYPAPRFHRLLPLVHGKIFVVTTFGYTLGLDLMTARFFILELPYGVQSNFMLAPAPNSGLYLVNAEGFQIRVWLHKMTGDNYGACGCRLLVDRFCVREACARNIWPDKVDVVAVGDNAEFVFLDHPGTGAVFYVHLRSKVVEKVYQRVPDRRGIPLHVYPIMMIWPPVFPDRNVGDDQEE